jgi:hypothetical protein
MRPQAPVLSLLVRAHQTRIARHIGGEDRGETAGRCHGSSSPTCSGVSSDAVYTTTRTPRQMSTTSIRVERIERGDAEWVEMAQIQGQNHELAGPGDRREGDIRKSRDAVP